MQEISHRQRVPSLARLLTSGVPDDECSDERWSDELVLRAFAQS
jgi:hypothetical protein